MLSNAPMGPEVNCEHSGRGGMAAWHSGAGVGKPFSVKDQVGNILGFVGHKASVTAIGLWLRQYVKQ